MQRRQICPACDSKNVAFRFDKGGYTILSCEDCRSMFVHDVPEKDFLARIYEAPTYYDLSPESIERIRREAVRRLALLCRWKSKGAYLDIGCAKGIQLDVARDAGFKTFGIDLSKENVTVCRKKGHHVKVGYLEDAWRMVPDGGFDVISCLDVIEHVEDPAGFLGSAVSMLADDGVMILSTPNYSGVVAKLLGRRDPFMTPPEHLNFFTAVGMRRLFERAGLRILRRVTFGTLTDEERERAVRKYFPSMIRPISPLVVRLIPVGMSALNAIKLGLEQEFYVAKVAR